MQLHVQNGHGILPLPPMREISHLSASLQPHSTMIWPQVPTSLRACHLPSLILWLSTLGFMSGHKSLQLEGATHGEGTKIMFIFMTIVEIMA